MTAARALFLLPISGAGEIIHIPVLCHPLNGKPVSAVGAEKQSRKHIWLVEFRIRPFGLSHLLYRFGGFFVDNPFSLSFGSLIYPNRGLEERCFPELPFALNTARIFLEVSFAYHSLKTFLNGVKSFSVCTLLSTPSFTAINRTLQFPK